jgi:ubiquitin-protein ligase E3 C
MLTANDNELYPNAQSYLLFGNETIHIYRFLGRILGKAVFDGITVDPRFANFFLRKLIGKSNSLNDLKSFDFELFKHLTFLKDYDGDIGDLELYFRVSDENHVTGETKEVDLVPNGGNVKVTN